MQRSRVGTIDELQAKGCLTGKVGSQPVCVFWSDGQAFAVDDRCPHMGFPLHRGSVENGLLTCHWHHARFDLGLGGHARPVRGRRERPRGGIRGQRRHRRPPAPRRPGGPSPAPARRGTRAGAHPRHGQGGAGPVRVARPGRRSAGGDPGGRRFRRPQPRGRMGLGIDRADRDGERSRPARPGRPGAGAGAWPRVRLPRHGRAASALSRSGPSKRRSRPTGSRRGTGGSSTPATATRPSVSSPRLQRAVRRAPRWLHSWARPSPIISSSTKATRSTSPTRPSRSWTISGGTRPARS